MRSVQRRRVTPALGHRGSLWGAVGAGTWGDLCIREVKRGRQDRHSHAAHTPPSGDASLCPHPTPTALPSGLDLVPGPRAPESAELGAPVPGEKAVFPGIRLSRIPDKTCGSRHPQERSWEPQRARVGATSTGAAPRGAR